jgi:tetratricopeptide (TPR) repeat protein
MYTSENIRRSPGSSMSRLILSLLFISVLAVVTFNRNTLWFDDFTLYGDVISKSPKKSRGYSIIATAYYSKNMIQAAITMYERAIERAANPVAYNALGNIYRDLGRPDKSIELFSVGITLNPGHAQLYNNRGIVYYQTGQYEKAIADYNRARSISSNSGETYVNLGNAYDEIGQPEMAIANYTEAIRLNPRYAAAFYNRCITLERIGRVAESRQDLLRACSLGYAEACASLRN